MTKKTPLINSFFIILFKTFRPFLGPAYCTFYLSCGHFACQELAEKNIITAAWSITKRLVACTFSFKKSE